jgi:hypothetical protein
LQGTTERNKEESKRAQDETLPCKEKGEKDSEEEGKKHNFCKRGNKMEWKSGNSW